MTDDKTQDFKAAACANGRVESCVSNHSVDRTCEDFDDPRIEVTLDNGHIERFFIPGLSDAEYIDRTIYLFNLGC